jgi:hypothetical protein
MRLKAKMLACSGLPPDSRGCMGKAVHRAYAKRALMKIPSLEDYEQRVA